MVAQLTRSSNGRRAIRHSNVERRSAESEQAVAGHWVLSNQVPLGGEVVDRRTGLEQITIPNREGGESSRGSKRRPER